MVSLWLDRVLLVLLGVWALGYGLLAVTNIRVEWMATIVGYAALVLGILCLVRLVMGWRNK